MSTVVLASLIALAAVPIEKRSGWAEFTRLGAFDRTLTTVEIGTLGQRRSVEGRRLKRQYNYWLRRTVTKRGRSQVTWVDSQTCPAVLVSLAALRDMKVPTIEPPGFGEGPPVILDGVNYSFRTSISSEGKLSLETNVGSALAGWVEASLVSLEQCWASRAPVLGD